MSTNTCYVVGSVELHMLCPYSDCSLKFTQQQRPCKPPPHASPNPAGLRNAHIWQAPDYLSCDYYSTYIEAEQSGLCCTFYCNWGFPFPAASFHLLGRRWLEYMGSGLLSFFLSLYFSLSANPAHPQCLYAEPGSRRVLPQHDQTLSRCQPLHHSRPGCVLTAPNILSWLPALCGTLFRSASSTMWRLITMSIQHRSEASSVNMTPFHHEPPQLMASPSS
jgi:hypothetical protein